MKVTTHMLGSRRVGQFIDLKSLDTNATVQEAIDKGYVVGKLELVVSAVCGVIRSMAAAVSKDGNGRKIDGYVSIQPSVKCKLADNCEPVSKDNVEASLRARVIKEGAIDTSGWSFTVEGATGALVINAITTGEVMGEVVIGEAIDFNGEDLNLPDTGAISWTATDGTQTLTGSIAAAKRTCSETRITIDKTAFGSLTSSDDGKEIVFTVKGCYNKATAKAIVKYVAPPPTIKKVVDTNHLESETDYIGEEIRTLKLFGEHLGEGTTLTVNAKESGDWVPLGSTVTELTDSSMAITLEKTAIEAMATAFKFIVTNANGTVTREIDTIP